MYKNMFYSSLFLFCFTLTESGDKRSSSDVVDDETGDDNDDFVGRPMRFFVECDVVDGPIPGAPIEFDDAAIVAVTDGNGVVSKGVVIDTGGVL